MRHRKKGSTLNRTQSHRRWLLSNLITSLFLHERIRTTTAKAKEARPLAEKLITFAKRGDLHARRQVLRVIRDKEVVAKLFEKISERFKNRPGGYTRILRLGNRLGDNADMALFELVQEEMAGKDTGRKRRRRSKKKKETAEMAAAKPAQEQATPEVKADEEAAAETAVEVQEETKAEDRSQESTGQPAGEEEKEKKE
ncbi:MAG: 50S ribosomal protein L17 [Candidatus Glassbacteria bacterium]